MNKFDLKNICTIHISGIGGIGVSALARMFLHEGKEVSGQDANRSPLTESLQAAGIAVSIGQDAANISKDTDLIVYSLAIAERDPKFLKSLGKLRIPMLSYPEALGLVSEGKYTIAVAGTHGKTTTTAMIAEVLVEAGLDPTVIVGSLLTKHQSNFIAGESKYFVVEADEYQRSFLHLSPHILVITNIGKDHLDYYKDFSDIQSAFRELVATVPKSGFIVARKQDPVLRDVLSKAKAKIIDYPEFLDQKLKLPVPGTHNKENAACALAVAHVLAVDPRVARKALAAFAGTWRRFDYRGKTSRGALVYDDYAHNPDKVRAAISGYREAFPKHRLTVVFQPHLYSRTKTLLDGFASAFDGADEVYIAPIFAAREQPDHFISSNTLARSIQKHLDTEGAALSLMKVFAASDMENLLVLLQTNLTANDLLVTMGAGDIYQLAGLLVQ